MRWRLAVPVLLLGLLPLTPAAHAAPRSSDVRRELTQATDLLHRSEARQTAQRARLHRLRQQIGATESAAAGLRDRVDARVRAAYTTGAGGQSLAALLSADDPAEVVERVALLEAMTRGDSAALTGARVLRRRLRVQHASAAAVQRQITAEGARLRAASARLAALFDQVVAQEHAAAERKAAEARLVRSRRLAAERARRAAAANIRRRALAAATSAAARRRIDRASRSAMQSAPPVGPGGHTCPVGPAHSFSDTWGAARSGGRRHQGTDVFAPYGAPAYAVTSGSITHAGRNRLGGIVLYLRGDDGDEYYYAHNSRNVAVTGQRVDVGELVGYVGDTGNAQGTPPHVHFERHPGGGAPVNPYPFLRAVCG